MFESEPEETKEETMAEGNNNKLPAKIACGTCSLIILIVSIILIAVSLKRLESTEYGIEYDKWAKTLDDAAKTGGLHSGPPGYYFVKFPSTQISADIADTCVSNDGLRVQINVTFQYQIPADYILPVVEKYRDFKSWATLVEATGVSAIQHTCSEYEVTDFQSLRNAIQDRMLENMRLKLEGSENDGINDQGVYALATSLQLRNIELPAQYKEAVSDKQKAEEDINLAVNQRTQETTKANTQLLAAKEEAIKITNKARNDAEVALTLANLKAQETLFSFEKEKAVLLQAKQDFNLGPNGILAYMTNQLYAKTGTLDIVMGEPAKISRKDALQPGL